MKIILALAAGQPACTSTFDGRGMLTICSDGSTYRTWHGYISDYVPPREGRSIDEHVRLGPMPPPRPNFEQDDEAPE